MQLPCTALLYFIPVHHTKQKMKTPLSSATLVYLPCTGNFGNVYRARLQKGEKQIVVAIKMIKNLEDPRDKSDFEREQGIMQQMAHPNIVRLYGLLRNEGTYVRVCVQNYNHVCALLCTCRPSINGARIHAKWRLKDFSEGKLLR